jgi:hypothetical protein
MYSTDPHQNEYIAAVAGMADHTPSPVSLPAEGDFVSGRTAGKTWSGYVEWLYDDGRFMCVNVGGSWLNVPVADITH